ncbi:hypothetical protein L195_g064330, partial [Trifolium pratense]
EGPRFDPATAIGKELKPLDVITDPEPD